MQFYQRYGFMAGLICAVIGVCETYIPASSDMVHSLFTNAVLAGLIGMMYMAVREHRESQEGLISFSEGFKTAIGVTLIATVMTAIAYYINLKFFNHQFALEQKESAKELANGAYTPEQIEAAKLLFTPGGLAVTIGIGTVIIGLVGSLLLAITMKNEDPNRGKKNTNAGNGPI